MLYLHLPLKKIIFKFTEIYMHIQIPPDPLHGSQITQYSCGYCKSQYTVEGTMRVLCRYCMPSSFSALCHSSSEYPPSILNGTATCSSHNGTS